jgi:hypothetical protein
VVTLVLGTLLPVLTGPMVSTALINVVWGSVYGFGFWLSSMVPVTSPGMISLTLTVSGMIIWPLLVLYGLYKAIYIFINRQNTLAITVGAILFVLSMLWNLQIGQVRQSFVYYLPLYTAFLDR